MKLPGPIVAIVCTIGIGCADTKNPTTNRTDLRPRQRQALADPFGYNAADQPDVSGGKINEFDKQGFKRDVDRVLNP